MSDSLLTYQAWPDAYILDELRVFKDYMRDGAETHELLAGLECIKFLTVASSDMDEDTLMFVDAAVEEANMRIDLMNIKDEFDKRRNEVYTDIMQTLDNFRNQIKSIDRMMRTRVDPVEFNRIINERVAKRLEDKKKVGNCCI